MTYDGEHPRGAAPARRRSDSTVPRRTFSGYLRSGNWQASPRCANAARSDDPGECNGSGSATAMARTWAARSGLLCGRRSSRCRNCSSDSAGICLRQPAAIALSFVKIVVERRFGNSHHLADFLNGMVSFPVQFHGKRELDRIEAQRSPAHAAARAATSPACVRSRIRLRSNSARAPNR